jgi:hypothetical protein
MCAEASTVFRAVAADFFYNCWYLEFPSDNRMPLYTCIHVFTQFAECTSTDCK